MRPLTSMLLAALSLLVVPVAAGASTVALQEVRYCTNTGSDCRYMDYSLGVVLRYDGELAEHNRVLVRRDGGALFVADSGAILRPGSGCVSADRHTARCDLATTRLVGYRLDGNDGDDVIAIAGGLSPSHAIAQPRLLLGGAGTDDLIDGFDASTLAGGPGADRLSGGEGDDRFGNVAESAERDDSATDAVDGGAGTDTVDYGARDEDLDLTLSGPRPGGGVRGEDDRLQGVEAIIGGEGDDRIVGSPRDDRLEGGGGADRALCGPGRDLVGQYLPDDFLGDTWSGPDPADVVSLDCEGVPFASDLDGGRDIRLDARPRRRGRTWTFANPCVQAGMTRCRGRLDVAVPGATPFARVRFAATGRVTVGLGPRNAARVARARRVSLRVTAQDLRRSGDRRATALTLSLAPAR